MVLLPLLPGRCPKLAKTSLEFGWLGRRPTLIGGRSCPTMRDAEARPTPEELPLDAACDCVCTMTGIETEGVSARCTLSRFAATVTRCSARSGRFSAAAIALRRYEPAGTPSRLNVPSSELTLAGNIKSSPEDVNVINPTPRSGGSPVIVPVTL